MTTIDDSTALGLGMLTFLLIVVLYVWTALALSAVLRKSGEQPWKAWVPILNEVVLLQLGGFSGWLFLLVLVPFVGPLVVWALLIVACYRINVAFGHGVGMTVLAALLLPVWASILGFGPARWLGTELGSRGAQGAGPRRTSAPDDDSAYVPRATPPAYSPTAPLPAAPTAGWAPPPVAPLPPAAEPARDWGGFDLGAVSELTNEVTGAHSAAPAPISALPVRSAALDAAADPVSEQWAPQSATPQSATPRSARASVSAQYTKAQIPDDPIDETIITRRRRTAWSLVPPVGAPIPLTAEVVLVGRKPTPDRSFPEAQLISIDDGTVSKTHARLALREDHWYVTDLGSTNGVLFATLMGTEIEAVPGEEVEAGERFFLGDAEVRLQRSEG